MLNRRPGLELDYEVIAAAAADAGTALEVNANPRRLDLSDQGVRAAVDAGATLVVNTDAHAPGEFDYSRYGVHTARRGWAEPSDVLNTWSVEEVRAFLDG
jgi:DNA polymerase (family 10)